MLSLNHNEKLSDLAEDAKELENDGAKFMDPGAKRKGRGRPKGSTGSKKAPEVTIEPPKDQQLPPPIPTTEMIRPFVEMLSAAMGRGFENKKAEMTSQEMDAITASTAMLADKWLPVMAGQYAAEFMFFTSVIVYGGRLYVIRSENIAAKRKRERDQFGGANGAVHSVHVAEAGGRGSAPNPNETVRDFAGPDSYGASAQFS